MKIFILHEHSFSLKKSVNTYTDEMPSVPMYREYTRAVKASKTFWGAASHPLASYGRKHVPHLCYREGPQQKQNAHLVKQFVLQHIIKYISKHATSFLCSKGNEGRCYLWGQLHIQKRSFHLGTYFKNYFSSQLHEKADIFLYWQHNIYLNYSD